MLTLNRIYIMLAVDILQDRSRGMAVAGLLMANTKAMNKPSLRTSVYTSLKQMCELGWMAKYRAGDESPFPFYNLTPKGKRLLWDTLNELEEVSRMAKKVMRKAA